MNKKIATPEKRNLLLSEAKTQIESMAEIYPDYVPEYDLLERLWGKNTLQAARIIAEEFVARFGTVSGTAGVLGRRLLPPGRAGTWANIEERISKICWVDNCSWSIKHDPQPDIPEEELFFLRVYDVIGALQKKRDYQVPEDKLYRGRPRDIADNFVVCELCWRSVPKLVHRKKIHLCHLHDIQSTSPEYRRRKYLKKFIEPIVSLLKNLVRAPYEVDCHPAWYVRALCVSEDSYLPYLANYLKSLRMPLAPVENVVRALEHPVYLEKFDEPVRQAWEFYFEDRGAYLEHHFERVLLAEAWLRADAYCKHGGKRQKLRQTFDAARYLDNEDVIAECLAYGLEDPNPEIFLAAVEDVAKAHEIAQLAKSRRGWPGRYS